VGLNDVAHNGQAEPGTGRSVAAVPVKALEDMGEKVGREAWTVVTDLDHRDATDRFHLRPHRCRELTALRTTLSMAWRTRL
jgi:hypothetical protein